MTVVLMNWSYERLSALGKDLAERVVFKPSNFYIVLVLYLLAAYWRHPAPFNAAVCRLLQRVIDHFRRLPFYLLLWFILHYVLLFVSIIVAMVYFHK